MANPSPPRHDYYDDRRPLFHQVIAARLRLDPRLLSVEKETLARWQALAPNRPSDIEWATLLERGAAIVIEEIEADTEEGRRLRQSSPLLSILGSG